MFRISLPRTRNYERVLNSTARFDAEVTYDAATRTWTTNSPETAATLRKAGAVVTEEN